MSLSLGESQAINEIAGILYDFLPGKPHPYADSAISFVGVAHHVGVADFWVGSSKLPAIVTLLERTLSARRSKFCPLVVEIVRKGITYRSKKGMPITREEIQLLNELISRVQFKIPELWDPVFLDSLPFHRPKPTSEIRSRSELLSLKNNLVKLSDVSPQDRGFAFEKFLQDLFSFFDLSPRRSFRLVGEQIDGSFQLDSDTYLVEAKWHQQQIGEADLLVFAGKVGKKSVWSRGLFVSYSGFTPAGLEAFSKGQATNIIGMDGQDLYLLLEGEMSLVEAIARKSRRAAETGQFFVSVYQLNREG